MSTETTTGTTLEILAPYFPYGIPCQVISGAYAGTQGPLVGLEAQKAFPVHLQDQAGPPLSVHYTDVLPVLRPFSALCTPLEDGTVPAVEVAKLLPGLTAKYNWEDATAELHGKDRPYIHVRTHYGSLIAEMYPDDYGLSEANLSASLAILDYLRKNHFAVGLTPDQYIAK